MFIGTHGRPRGTCIYDASVKKKKSWTNQSAPYNVIEITYQAINRKGHNRRICLLTRLMQTLQ